MSFLKKTFFFSQRYSFISAALWLMAVTVLLILPGSAIPSNNWFEKIRMDLWVHFFLFGILVHLWNRYVYHLKNTSGKLKVIFLQIAVAAFIYGIIMECVQHFFVTNRSFDVADIAADGLGSFSGLMVSRKSYIKK
ncbi:MAG: VanZ family protein [Chitinophagaceae bacterium]|nr:VanZ family protein [Chitinophagaceae bacterium]